MREIRVAVVLIAALASCAIALLSGDRRTMTPAPEAVGEGLVRQLAAHRADRTRQYLARDVRKTYSPGWLRNWMAGVEAMTGPVANVTGEQSQIENDSATAVVSIKGKRRTVSLTIGLSWESGQWKVVALPPPALLTGQFAAFSRARIALRSISVSGHFGSICMPNPVLGHA